jgi:hypothetical protein
VILERCGGVEVGVEDLEDEVVESVRGGGDWEEGAGRECREDVEEDLGILLLTCWRGSRINGRRPTSFGRAAIPVVDSTILSRMYNSKS